MKIRTEFNFILPKGNIDENGNQIKIRGVMKLIKVKDLLDIYHDTRVKSDSSYFYVIVLTKVVDSLTSEKVINSKIIENLAPENFAFLVDFFNEINHKIITSIPIKCTNCKNNYLTEINLVGEI